MFCSFASADICYPQCCGDTAELKLTNTKRTNKIKMDEQIFKEVDNYINNLFAVEDEHLKEVVPSLKESNMQHASISPNQGKFLQIVAKLCNAKRILEIGTLGGYSSIWLARTLPADGQLITIELDIKHAEIAKTNITKAGLQSKVDIRVGKALDILQQLENENAEPFDMIFIDADKPPYTEYLHWAIRLSRQGTVIIADNVIRNGKVLDENSSDQAVQGVQRFNETLAKCSDLTSTIIQTIGIKEYDGMAIAVVNRR